MRFSELVNRCFSDLVNRLTDWGITPPIRLILPKHFTLVQLSHPVFTSRMLDSINLPTLYYIILYTIEIWSVHAICMHDTYTLVALARYQADRNKRENKVMQRSMVQVEFSRSRLDLGRPMSSEPNCVTLRNTYRHTWYIIALLCMKHANNITSTCERRWNGLANRSLVRMVYTYKWASPAASTAAGRRVG